jgi:hypothetical protein
LGFWLGNLAVGILYVVALIGVLQHHLTANEGQLIRQLVYYSESSTKLQEAPKSQ